MAAYRRALIDASKHLKQAGKLGRVQSKASILQRQVRCLAAQQSSLVQRVSNEMSLAKQGKSMKFSTLPNITSSVLLSTMTTTADGLVNSDGSGSSESLEGSSNDEEGLVTPALEDIDDL